MTRDKAPLLLLLKPEDDMKNLYRGLCLAVFLTGSISFSQTPVIVEGEIEPALPYTVITIHYRVSPDGHKTFDRTRIRYVKANGEWRQMRYDPETNGPAKDSWVFASTQEGVFIKAPGHKRNLSPSASQQMQEFFRSARRLRSQMNLVRVDEVAGLEVYVLREEVDVSGHPMEWIERSYSPKTGYIPLREVIHFRDCSEIGMEAQRVEFGNVPENLNDDLKSSSIQKKN
jgi:hypothetical protein